VLDWPAGLADRLMRVRPRPTSLTAVKSAFRKVVSSMIYTVPWAPVIALSTVVLLFLVVPLVAFAALATMLLVLILAIAATLVAAAVTVPALVLAAIRRLPRPSVLRLRLRLRHTGAVADARLDRVR
jgi:hypothetical protein